MLPITYTVERNGHLIHAVASGSLTAQDFIDYEKAHSIDQRLIPPVVELLELSFGACKDMSSPDFNEVLEFRKTLPDPPKPHRCAILVSYADEKCWDIAEIYSGMVNLHFPESVIVFGDARTARIWLGIEQSQPT